LLNVAIIVDVWFFSDLLRSGKSAEKNRAQFITGTDGIVSPSIKQITQFWFAPGSYSK
jgi:hypothetical protein